MYHLKDNRDSVKTHVLYFTFQILKALSSAKPPFRRIEEICLLCLQKGNSFVLLHSVFTMLYLIWHCIYVYVR